MISEVYDLNPTDKVSNLRSGNKYTINLVKKTSIAAALIAICGASIMYTFGEQSSEMTMIAISVCMLTSAMASFIHYFPNNALNPYILIVGCMLAILVPTLLSGGVNSRFVVLVPILPVLMSLILNRRDTLLFASVLIIYAICLGVFEHYIPDFSSLVHIEQERFPKTLWLVLSIIFALSFALIFSDVNSKLTIRLESTRTNTSGNHISDKHSILEFAANSLLKLNSTSTNNTVQRRLAILMIEVTAVESETQSQTVSSFVQQTDKLLNNTNNMLGNYDANIYIASVMVRNNEEANTIANKIIMQGKASRDSNAKCNVNIGLISVAANSGVDIHSLISVASIALRRSFQKGIDTAINYEDIKT